MIFRIIKAFQLGWHMLKAKEFLEKWKQAADIQAERDARYIDKRFIKRENKTS